MVSTDEDVAREQLQLERWPVESDEKMSDRAKCRVKRTLTDLDAEIKEHNKQLEEARLRYGISWQQHMQLFQQLFTTQASTPAPALGSRMVASPYTAGGSPYMAGSASARYTPGSGLVGSPGRPL